MKRKIVSAMLVATMVLSLFTGCGDTKKEAGVSDTGVLEQSETVEQTENTETEQAGGEGDAVQSNVSAEELKNAWINSDYEPALPTSEEQADIYVQKIDGLSEDFIKGMDISIVLAEEASGVVYYNEEGQEEDVFKQFADAGVNYIRVRVWNDPYDEDGKGYGGGNCDASVAAEIGRRAAEYGMKLNVDFHYSDFWADPSKQMCPKAWEDMDIDEKAEALYAYTQESLETILLAGANVGMVQIGNEINTGMAGETTLTNKLKLLKAGSAAVRAVAEKAGADIKVAVHFTNLDHPDNIAKIAGELAEAELDYDIFGASYYPFWHGTIENMKKVLSDIKTTYGVETCIMETSYPFTGEEGDGSSNSVSEGDLLDEYPATPQGQANAIRDVMAAASEIGSMGVFYWEGAWVPVGSDAASNSKLWEEFGSGWASSFAKTYDPKDAGQYYGGSSWDNQAFFDFDGKALPSINVFKYVNYGAVGNGLEVIHVPNLKLELGIGTTLELPEAVPAVYNDSSCTEPVAVTWNAGEVSAVDMNTAGNYKVTGATSDGTEIVADIKVASVNYVKNPGFEEEDSSMWVTNSLAGSDPTDIQTKASDAHDGEKALHFWSEASMEFTVEQVITDIPAGTYAATANLQGGDVGSDADFYLYVRVGDQVYQSDSVALTGWVDWKTPVLEGIEVDGSSEVAIGIYAKSGAKGWGTFDDLELYPMK